MKKHRIGIVGAGSRGVDCFGQLFRAHDRAELVALCDTNSVRLAAANDILGGDCALYSDLPEMLDSEDLDAVVVTTPDCSHADHACAALEKGVAVLIDKPLATTVAGCKRIIECAEKNSTLSMIGFNLRHHNTLQELKKVIDNGDLGRVFMIENREFYDGGRTYMARWNRSYEKCGGLWIHKGSHDFDVLHWLLGFPKPVRVVASAAVNVLNPDNIPFEVEEGKDVGPTCSTCAYAETCPDMKAEDGAMWNAEAQTEDGYAKDTCIYLSEKDVHDNGFSIVEYDNGARASHMECFVTGMSDRLYTVIGDRGQAEVSLANRTISIKPRWGNGARVITAEEGTGGHGGADPNLIENFLSVLDGKRAVGSTLEHGLWSTAVGQAAEIASREKRSVLIDELMNSHLSSTSEN